MASTFRRLPHIAAEDKMGPSDTARYGDAERSGPAGPQGAYGPRTPASVLHLAANEELFGEQAPVDGFFKVVTGVVRTCRALSLGRRQIDAFHVPGDLFGFEMGDRRMLSAEAACAATVICYKYHPHKAVAANDEDMAQQVFAHALRNLARAQEHAVLLGRRTAIEKVAAFLVDWAANFPASETVLLAMTRQDIADYLGLTVETVSRTLAELQRGAFIELNTAREIALTNPTGLRSLAS